MKIIFFGDSLTQGTMGVGYVDRIATLLPGHHFINQGINGDTSLNLYRRVDADVIAEKPEGVYIMVGINDAVSHAEPGARSYYRLVKGCPGGHVGPLAFRENLRAILMKLRHAGIRAWVALPPIEYRPATVAALREMNTYAQTVCEELEVPTLDLMAALVPPEVPERPPVGLWTWRANLQVVLGRADYDRLRRAGGFTYSFDGLHLTEDGAARVAVLAADFLRHHGLG